MSDDTRRGCEDKIERSNLFSFVSIEGCRSFGRLECGLKRIMFGVVLVVVAMSMGCAAVPGQFEKEEGAFVQRGMASYYGKALHGNTTASGETFNMHEFTAAHRSLPFGTVVRVTRMDTGQYVVVKINDRGPYAKGRIIDLSRAAARSIDMLSDGVAEVVVEVVGHPD